MEEFRFFTCRADHCDRDHGNSCRCTRTGTYQICKKSRLQVYLDTASEIEKSVVNMVVDAEEDGYAIRAVTYKGSTEDGSGNGTLICANASGYADMASAADKAKYFSEMFRSMGMGSVTLYMNGDTPLQIALSEMAR